MATLFVPFKFTHDFVKKRHRKTEHVWDQDELAVEVREIKRRDVSLVAELAFTKRYGGDEVNTRFGYTPDGARRDIVWFENECWIEQGDYEAFRDDVMSGSTGKGTPFHHLGHNPQVSDIKPFDEAAFVEMVGPLASRTSTKPNVEQKIQNRVAELISIDGVLFCRIDEPYLTASKYLGEVLAGKTIEHDLVGLSLDRRSDGVIHKVPLAKQRRRLDRIGDLSNNVSVKVVDPSRLYEVPERTAAITAAHQIMAELLRNAEDLPILALDAAYALRDALTAFPRHLAPAVIEALETIRDLDAPDPEWLARASRVYQSTRFDNHYTRKANTLEEALASIYGLVQAKAAGVVEIASSLDRSECDDSKLPSAAIIYSADQRCQLIEVTSRDERRKIARLMQCDPDLIEAAARMGRIVIAEKVENHYGPDLASSLIMAALITPEGVESLYNADVPQVASRQALDLAETYAEMVALPELELAGARP